MKTDFASIVQVNVPPPNVLFLLDTGSPMIFSPKGIMPLITVHYAMDDDTGEKRKTSEKLKNSTERSWHENGQMEREVLPDGTERRCRDVPTSPGDRQAL